MTGDDNPGMAWQLCVDRGGTFTDVVLRGPDGAIEVRKLPTEPAAGGENATVTALREAAAAGRALSEIRVGTTLATNALLERAGERVLLVTTRGFADLLAIGFQDRPDLFALRIEKPGLLHERVVEIDERVLADGSVRRAPDEAQVRAVLAAGRRDGFDCLAVLLLHSIVHPEHERLVGRIASELGYRHVALSHKVSPEPGAVLRGGSTVTDAYLTPLLRRHLGQVAAAAPAARVLFMQSSGGLAEATYASGKDAILSGPAGGVIAVAEIARLSGLRSVIGLDMGGTSTDVCRCAPEPERVFKTEAGGVTVRAPALSVVTVAAGGGSRLRFRDGRFQVGPDSAGADPGPAAYGRGGPATVTDANVVLGRIRPEHFPHLQLDVGAARRALAAFGEPEVAAAGFVAIANENMAAAIRAISTQRGLDARDDALCCFGGAGGQHACALAQLLGMSTVIVHPLAGVLSAWGLSLAELRHHAVAAVRAGQRPVFPEAEAAAALAAQGGRDVLLERSVDVRYAGAEHALNVPWSERWEADFVEAHQAQFGFVQEGRIELVAARVEAIARAARVEDVLEELEPCRPEPEPTGACSGGDDGDGGAPPVYRRAALRPGATLQGPALIVEDNATTWVEAGWSCSVDARRWLRLVRTEAAARTAPRAAPAPVAVPALLSGAGADPVGLEVMGNRFMAIASRMGEHLRRVAHSTNIKERLDYSCALFDSHGGLVANAPHIPVHLGAMGETVAALLAERPMREGDVWLSNDPYKGGSHLPDLTVITPVFRRGQLAFLVANRGHHADVGGPTPGSMPPASSTLAEEGVLFSNERLVEAGRLCEREIGALMEAAGVRGIDERLADLRAQIASNAEGARRLQELCDELGAATVGAWMRHVADNAAAVMRDVLAALLEGRARRRFAFANGLDDGTRIAVAIDVEADGPDGPRARIDFAGTSPQHPGNRNAPRAVAVAAVLYVFRTLAARPIPLNAGCLRPLQIVVPPGSLLDPQPPAAVCGGNVETSQRLVDVLYGALDRQAAAQGTMNNVTFGDAGFGYYETVCGGAGAGFGWDGASAVHTHMTNTRITDVEVLERRCPVVVREFSIRRGSGGEGVWRGGDGVVRDLEFLRPLSVSVLAERRTTAPFGLHAGPGARGEQQVTPTSLRLLTPGGGGCSPSAAQWAAMTPAAARRIFREDRWRGRTADIATGWRHAQLVVVPAHEVAAMLALTEAAGLRLLHCGAPGVSTLRDRFGAADLSTDLPLYRERDGRETSGLPVAPDEVALLFLLASGRGGHGDEWPALAAAHRGGAPGRLFITDQPV